MFNHCHVPECVCVCVHVRVTVRDCVCVCLRVSVCVCVWVCQAWHPVSLLKKTKEKKKDQMSLLLCLVTLCLFRLYLRPLWSTLIFYYLLLSDYRPSCYMLYKEPTLISSSPPSVRVEGSVHLQFQVIHKVGFIEFRYIFLTFILLWWNTLVSVWKLLVCWCFEYHVTFTEVKGIDCPRPNFKI